MSSSIECALLTDDLQITLPVLIAAFTPIACHQGWDSQAGAWACCGEASDAFLRFLTGYGVGARRVGLTGLPPFVNAIRDIDDFETGGLEYHLVVAVGELCFDWTRRQYQPLANFPHVATVKHLQAEGWMVSDVEEKS